MRRPARAGLTGRLETLVTLVGGPGKLSRLSAVPERSLRHYLTGKEPKASVLVKLAGAAAVRVEWLLTGAGPMRVGAPARMAAEGEATYKLDAGPTMKGRVPVISWVQAGSWASAVDNFAPGDAKEWTETTVPIRQHTYALRVRGDSMTDPAGDPTFPDGSIIVVEPDAIGDLDHMVNSYVIVRRTTDDEATFKQLVKDAGRYFLKPLNPRYPMIELGKDDVFCGVVREKIVRFF